MGGGPTFKDLERGLNRAYWWVPRWRTEEQGGGFGTVPNPGAPLPTPSRQTMLGIGRMQSPPGLPFKKAEQRAMETDYAKKVTEHYQGGGPGGSSNRGDKAPTDPSEPKAGTGMSASSAPGAPQEPEGSKYGDYKIVRMPDGKIVVTNDPSQAEDLGGVTDPEGARSASIQGPYGSVFSNENLLIGEGADTVNLPYDADRSPGWAARQALNERFRSGDLSMNARDVEDRRRFEEGEMARDQAVRDTEVESAMKELELIAAERQATIDPYTLAEIEAQGRYGGAMLTEQAAAARQTQALGWFLDLTKRIRAMEAELAGIGDPKSAQALALKQAIDRAVQERREIANIAMGFRINDPRQADAFAAMAALIGGGLGAGGGGETGG